MQDARLSKRLRLSSENRRKENKMKVTALESPPTVDSNSYYTTNRQPLLPNPLVKLPVGAIGAKGWLAHQLELMVDGMTGRLYELSNFLKPDNGWLDIDNAGHEHTSHAVDGARPKTVPKGLSNRDLDGERSQ